MYEARRQRSSWARIKLSIVRKLCPSCLLASLTLIFIEKLNSETSSEWHNSSFADFRHRFVRNHFFTKLTSILSHNSLCHFALALLSIALAHAFARACFQLFCFQCSVYSVPNTPDSLFTVCQRLGQTKPSFYISDFLAYYKKFYCQVVF